MGETIESKCPNCGAEEARGVYDIGDGPELCCVHCDRCWGADGQPLKPLDVEGILAEVEAAKRLSAQGPEADVDTGS